MTHTKSNPQNNGHSASHARERAVIAALIEADGNLPPFLARILHASPESFDDQRIGQIAVTVKSMRGSGDGKVSVVDIPARCSFPDPVQFIAQLSADSLPVGLAEFEAETLWKEFTQRQTSKLLSEASAAMQSAPGKALDIATRVISGLSNLSTAHHAKTLADRIADRRFNILIKPPRPEPQYFILGTPVCTAGNLTAISGPPKAAKSAILGAMEAAAMTPTPDDVDTLGITSSNPRELALIHFDTEQSPYDHYVMIERELRRAGLTAPPPWLWSICITGFTATECRQTIKLVAEQARQTFGGIHSVLIDGVADCATDVNDPAETGELISEWHALAIENHCSVIGNIHLNPGTEKTRGHLGSQLERKAETNLRAEKDENEIVVLWGEKNRHAPIPKQFGPCFAWDIPSQMHLTVATRAKRKDAAEYESLQLLAIDAFNGKSSMRYYDLRFTVKSLLTVSDRTAERKVSRMIELTVIRKSMLGFYEMSTPPNT